jgi:hypothetical protein
MAEGNAPPAAARPRRALVDHAPRAGDSDRLRSRLGALFDAPADGSAFLSLSSKIAGEESALAAATTMSAKRRSRLEIAAGPDADESGVIEVVEDGAAATYGRGAPARPPHSADAGTKRKAAAAAPRAVAGDDDDDAEVKAGMRLLKHAVRERNHGLLLPHQDRPDYEFRLRRVATSGCVRLFNALAQAQSAGASAQAAAEREMTMEKAEGQKMVASREAFLSALAGAASSSRAATNY